MKKEQPKKKQLNLKMQKKQKKTEEVETEEAVEEFKMK